MKKAIKKIKPKIVKACGRYTKADIDNFVFPLNRFPIEERKVGIIRCDAKMYNEYENRIPQRRLKELIALRMVERLLEEEVIHFHIEKDFDNSKVLRGELKVLRPKEDKNAE